MYQIGREEAEAVRRVIESGKLFRYPSGEVSEAAKFEREWEAKLGCKYAITVTSGTTALMCGLVGLGVGPGDEVIVPGYTFIASPHAVLAVGAIPVIAEIDESLGMDPADVEKRITPRTKAIMPVHMMGLPADLDAILAVGERHGIPIIEDACQAVGGSYKGKRLATHGKVGGFSFNYFKIISCGEGGSVVTDDEIVFQRAAVFHDGGSIFRDHAGEFDIPIYAGMNFRTNNILAAVMREQLKRLDTILAGLRVEKRTTLGELADVSAFRPNPQNEPEGDCGVCAPVLFETKAEAERFMARCEALGVSASSPINSGRHVYSNWSTVLEKRGAHHPKMDPYNLTDVEYEYTPDMCPRTLDILERTVSVIGMKPDRPKDQLMEQIALVKQAAETM